MRKTDGRPGPEPEPIPHPLGTPFTPSLMPRSPGLGRSVSSADGVSGSRNKATHSFSRNPRPCSCWPRRAALCDPSMTGAGCPWQDDRGHCTAREARPIGCRAYFCDPAFQDHAPALTETAARNAQTTGRSPGIALELCPRFTSTCGACRSRRTASRPCQHARIEPGGDLAVVQGRAPKRSFLT